MNLQAFVNDTTDFSERSIVITGITDHIYEMGCHRYWTNGDVNCSPSAQRFYVGEQDGCGGATYLIPDEIILSLRTTAIPLKLLPPGKTDDIIDVNAVDYGFLPTTEVNLAVHTLTSNGQMYSRTAGYLKQAAEKIGCRTLKDIQKKTTKTELRAIPGVGEKVIKKLEEMLQSAGLKIRE